MRIPVKWGCIAVAVFLGGCGNTYEKITVGEWEAVGKSKAPEPAPEKPYIVETMQAGTGAVVSAGDLVKARLEVLAAGKSPAPQDVWVWVGHEPIPPGTLRPTSASFARLGSSRFRAALIGRQLNEKFGLRGVRDSLGDIDHVPLYALRAGELTYDRLTDFIFEGQHVFSPQWPAVEIPLPREGPDLVAHVEILAICKAQLYQRTAMMRQWGIPFRFADMNPATSRKGYLGWSMIEAQCPGERERIRVQAGPFYDPYFEDRGRLLDWKGSYANLRPPSKFPEEWSADVARAGLK
jgi:hypothetical protein